MYRRADSSVARPDGVQAAYQGSITVGDGLGVTGDLSPEALCAVVERPYDLSSL
jgi:hypothetical protein